LEFLSGRPNRSSSASGDYAPDCRGYDHYSSTSPICLEIGSIPWFTIYVIYSILDHPLNNQRVFNLLFSHFDLHGGIHSAGLSESSELDAMPVSASANIISFVGSYYSDIVFRFEPCS